MKEFYFDDVKVGDRYKSEPFAVTQNTIVAFAREYDVQPFHMDPVAAKESVFGGLAASGWHTAAIAMRLFTTGPLRFHGGAIGLGVDELRWPTAVRPGDMLQLETVVLDMRPSKSKPRYGIIRVRNVMTNQRGEVVLSYTANAFAQRHSL